MERLGLGYEDLRATNDQLIYVSLSGLGDHPSIRRRRVYDFVSQGLAGFCSVQADRMTGEPRTIQTAIADKIASLVVWQGVTAALLHRLRSGRGQHIKVNMLSAALSFLWPESMAEATFIGPGIQTGGAIAGIQYVFATKDGHIVVGHVSNDEFEEYCRALGLEQYLSDPRFDSIAKRYRNAAQLNRIVADTLATRKTAYWLERLAARDTVYAPVNTAETIADDEIVRNLGILDEHLHPVYGAFRQPIHPISFSATPARYSRHAPLLGEHTDEVLSELSRGSAK
jgi:crotonobetainyl-CoA:carnitine CoA-transferase CaiB-like acyl-CoA transferase